MGGRTEMGEGKEGGEIGGRGEREDMIRGHLVWLWLTTGRCLHG